MREGGKIQRVVCLGDGDPRATLVLLAALPRSAFEHILPRDVMGGNLIRMDSRLLYSKRILKNYATINQAAFEFRQSLPLARKSKEKRWSHDGVAA